MLPYHHQNINKLIISRLFPGLLFFIMMLCLHPALVSAQELPASPATDSLVSIDSLFQVTDSIAADSLALSGKKKPLLEAEVVYSSEDSLIFSIRQQKVFLFDDGSVNYQDITLKGDYIEFDYDTKIVLAAGAIDSAGQLAGKPEFTQGSDTYNSDTMRYNFETRKGYIKNIITKQGEGFLHSTRTKRLEDGEIHVNKGKYTTCDDPHPHFFIALTKAIAIPGEKIVSGPAYLVFEDIPMPLGLPFGFFPNSDKRSSGFIIPEFRDEDYRGFGLENGGWYFALNDYLDVTLLASVFSRGTWGVKTISSYQKRYKFSGQFMFQYYKNQINDDPTIPESQDFKINWNHSQDPKANPTRTFRASVDFASSSFEQNQSTNINSLLTNQKNSSISFTKNWPGRPFNFSANLNHSQSSKTHLVNMTLPSMTFNMNRLYPFRNNKKNDGKYNWFENIQISYNSKFENKLKDVPDSTFFTESTWKHMRSGFSHTIPISLTNIKLLKFINITPSVSYSGVLYPSYISKRVMTDTSIFRSNAIEIDTINKITYAQAFSTSLSISASPKLYGMFISTSPTSYIAAVRHVLTPSASVSFTPDMSGLVPDYYRKVAYPASISQPVKISDYSVYEGQLYGTPSVNGRSGSVALRLMNNLEMKVRSKNDTTGEGKKVIIFDNLDLSTNYNPFAPENKWSNLNLTGSTALFKRNLTLQVGSSFDPYALDSTGKVRSNEFLIRETGKLFRVVRASMNIGFSLKSSAGDKKGKPLEGTTEETFTEDATDAYDMYDEAGGAYVGEYVDFDIPWTLNFDYAWSYSRQTSAVATISNTIRVRGDLSLTPKWKLGANTGYDFVTREFTTTNISIHRDLHCWDMRFSVVPFGSRKSYSFTISAKSALLRDLKWDKRKSWYDNF